MNFWLQRWADGRTAWHQHAGSSALRRHWRLRRGSVLVPLCGKSVDLRWLAEHGHSVVGVELAEQGIRAFFEEQGLEFEERGASFVATELPITIHWGDYFEFEGIRCDALYDRAALIALPPERRAAYVEHTNSLLVPDAERLVITLEYDQTRAEGPPYSVLPGEVNELFPMLQELERTDALAEAPPKFREAGIEAFTEVVWR
ncbi:MAG: thiopurine S-methyltransferase [Planctomycetes bacterium]|nr:thiopurine S-methyltransferase [Planctomycetota bacterium]